MPQLQVALIEPAVDAECLTTEVFAQIRASLPFLGGALEVAGIPYRIFCEELVSLEARLDALASAYPVVGISTTINTVERACWIARELKRRNASLRVVFGGHAAGPHAARLLETGDYCLSGRAEVTFPCLLRALFPAADGVLSPCADISEIPNLIFRSAQGALSRTRSERLVADFPSRYDRIENYGGFSQRRNALGLRKPPLHSVFASTGCVRQCRFCITERKYAVRPVEHVIADVREILARHRTLLPPRIMIVDDCAFGNLSFLKNLLVALADLRKTQRFSVMLQFHVEPLIRDPELGLLFREAGVQMLLLGLESASDRTLGDERKGTRVEDNLAAIRICRRNGIIPYGYFMAGFDSESPGDIQETFGFIEKHQLVAQVLPLGLNPDEQGRSPRTLDPYSFGATVFVSHRPALLSPEALQQELLNGYDRIYSFGRLFSLPSWRERLYHVMFWWSFRSRWRKRILAHIERLRREPLVLQETK